MSSLNLLKPLEIKSLIPTHNRLRNLDRFNSIKNTHFLPPVLSEIGDDIFIHDGHHRLVCMIDNGIKEITEYNIEKFTKEDYEQINFDRGYVTPFNIYNECRLPDFYNFKKVIIGLYKNTPSYILRKTITSSKKYYCEPRTVYTLEQMYKEVKFAL